MKNILCFDFGKIRIGISCYNSLISEITPLVTIKNISLNLNYIRTIIFTKNPLLILVGFPKFYKKLIKSYIELIFLIKKFIKNLINKFNIKIKIFDESYSSKFIKNNKSKDSYSACFILKNYLNFLGR